jgi:uncharacterized membrane protein
MPKPLQYLVGAASIAVILLAAHTWRRDRDLEHQARQDRIDQIYGGIAKGRP